MQIALLLSLLAYVSSKTRTSVLQYRGGASPEEPDQRQQPRGPIWGAVSDVFRLNREVKETDEAEDDDSHNNVDFKRGGALVTTMQRKSDVPRSEKAASTITTNEISAKQENTYEPQDETFSAENRTMSIRNDSEKNEASPEEQSDIDIDEEEEDEAYYQDDDVETTESGDITLESVHEDLPTTAAIEDDDFFEKEEYETESIDQEDAIAEELEAPSLDYIEEELPGAEVDEAYLLNSRNAARLWFANEFWRFEFLERLEKARERQQRRSLQQKNESAYLSSGYWATIDAIASFGLSRSHEEYRLSRRLRTIRKAAAHMTGLHGFVSGKPLQQEKKQPPEELLMVQRRLAAIDRARQLVEEKQMVQEKEAQAKRVRPRRGLFGRRRRQKQEDVSLEAIQREQRMKQLEEEMAQAELKLKIEEMQRRKQRVEEIDKLITQGQKDLVKLQCEKDELQQRPNPLFNYTTITDEEGETTTTRDFSFPPENLVDEYLEELFGTGRLIKMNHTELWKSGDLDLDDEDEEIGDDLLTPSADAHKLYENSRKGRRRGGRNGRDSNGRNGGGGSWLLRQTIGKGTSLGEKIGEAAETAGYKAVCGAVMGVLARSISGLHGINVMTHSDIRLFMEQSPDLPPLSKSALPNAETYAQAALQRAIRRSKRKRRHSKRQDPSFMQRDAVVETLLSHCQISAPLLKLFPLAWQRGLLANLITLIAAVVSDFCDGIQLQILGHTLTFSFNPITETDMIAAFSSRRALSPQDFEAAVQATADDLSHQLKFLDRWHERALGSGMLRAQIANLIARLVLTLTDDVLSGARMDLWSAQAAAGPRIVAGLEYRTTGNTQEGIPNNT